MRTLAKIVWSPEFGMRMYIRNAAVLDDKRGPAFARSTGTLCTKRSSLASNYGFTLIEILVAITILLTLMTLVVIAFNANTGSDKVRSSARVAQSAFLGARDRALHAKDRRGIRLIRDQQDPTIVTGFVYLQPIENLKYGLAYGGIPVQIEYVDTNGDMTVDAARRVRGTGDGLDWDYLDQNNLLSYPHRVRIPATTTGQWFTFKNVQVEPVSNPKQVTFELTADYPFADNALPGAPPPIAVPQGSANASCEIEIGFELLPNHAPITLPSGMVIDLDYSSTTVSTNWPATPQPTNIEIMFSPRGMITGPIAALGPMHFLINDIQDATQNLNPIDPANKGEKLVLTVFPQTGNVATFPIDPTDAVNNSTGAATPDGLADDLFRYARLGSTAR